MVYSMEFPSSIDRTINFKENPMWITLCECPQNISLNDSMPCVLYFCNLYSFLLCDCYGYWEKECINRNNCRKRILEDSFLHILQTSDCRCYQNTCAMPQPINFVQMYMYVINSILCISPKYWPSSSLKEKRDLGILLNI